MEEVEERNSNLPKKEADLVETSQTLEELVNSKTKDMTFKFFDELMKQQQEATNQQ